MWKDKSLSDAHPTEQDVSSLKRCSYKLLIFAPFQVGAGTVLK